MSSKTDKCIYIDPSPISAKELTRIEMEKCVGGILEMSIIGVVISTAIAVALTNALDPGLS